jgi:actin
MSLYAAGRTTGLVCDAGDGFTYTIPFFEGYSIPHAIYKMEIAGRILTNYMRKLSMDIGASLSSFLELEIVRDIKEKLSFVAQNYEQENQQAQFSSEHDKSYTMPDKRVITVPAHVRMTCPELLFKPALYNKSCDSIQAILWKSI